MPKAAPSRADVELIGPVNRLYTSFFTEEYGANLAKFVCVGNTTAPQNPFALTSVGQRYRDAIASGVPHSFVSDVVKVLFGEPVGKSHAQRRCIGRFFTSVSAFRGTLGHAPIERTTWADAMTYSPGMLNDAEQRICVDLSRPHQGDGEEEWNWQDLVARAACLLSARDAVALAALEEQPSANSTEAEPVVHRNPDEASQVEEGAGDGDGNGDRNDGGEEPLLRRPHRTEEEEEEESHSSSGSVLRLPPVPRPVIDITQQPAPMRVTTITPADFSPRLAWLCRAHVDIETVCVNMRITRAESFFMIFTMAHVPQQQQQQQQHPDGPSPRRVVRVFEHDEAPAHLRVGLMLAFMKRDSNRAAFDRESDDPPPSRQ